MYTMCMCGRVCHGTYVETRDSTPALNGFLESNWGWEEAGLMAHTWDAFAWKPGGFWVGLSPVWATVLRLYFKKDCKQKKARSRMGDQIQNLRHGERPSLAPHPSPFPLSLSSLLLLALNSLFSPGWLQSCPSASFPLCAMIKGDYHLAQLKT